MINGGSGMQSGLYLSEENIKNEELEQIEAEINYYECNDIIKYELLDAYNRTSCMYLKKALDEGKEEKKELYADKYIQFAKKWITIFPKVFGDNWEIFFDSGKKLTNWLLDIADALKTGKLNIFNNELTVTIDYDVSIAALKCASTCWSGFASYKLATYYAKGQYVELNEEMAEHYLWRAARDEIGDSVDYFLKNYFETVKWECKESWKDDLIVINTKEKGNVVINLEEEKKRTIRYYLLAYYDWEDVKIIRNRIIDYVELESQKICFFEKIKQDLCNDKNNFVAAILKEYPNSWQDKRRFAALIHDYIPDNKLFQNLVIGCIENSIVKELNDFSEHGGNMSRLQINNYAKRLVNAYGCQIEYAIYIVELWVNSFGIIIE